MLHPAPTTKIDPVLARGVLAEHHPETPNQQAKVVLTFPNTNYQIHLRPIDEITSAVGKRILGTIHAEARRVDVVTTGGRYTEPVFGRPRRVQGSVVGRDDAKNVLVVDAGFPIHCTLTAPNQNAADFEDGAFVSFDIKDGATLTPQA
ncbi:MAG: hypothetical protein AAGK04_05310 [Planctomycetota bacterium]